MFRDLTFDRIISLEPVRHLRKQTFDLVLTLSDHSLVLIEAKAHHGFGRRQLKRMEDARELLKKNSELGITEIYLAGRCSSRYKPVNVESDYPDLTLFTWECLVLAYPEIKSQLSRADLIYMDLEHKKQWRRGQTSWPLAAMMSSTRLFL